MLGIVFKKVYIVAHWQAANKVASHLCLLDSNPSESCETENILLWRFISCKERLCSSWVAVMLAFSDELKYC